MQIQVPQGSQAMTAGRSLVKEVIESPKSGFKRTIMDRKDTFSFDDYLSEHTPSTAPNHAIDLDKFFGTEQDLDDDAPLQLCHDDLNSDIAPNLSDFAPLRSTTGGKSMSLGLNVPPTPQGVDFATDTEGEDRIMQDCSDSASEFSPEIEEDDESGSETTLIRPTPIRPRTSVKRLPSYTLDLEPSEDSDSESDDDYAYGLSAATTAEDNIQHEEQYDDAFAAAFARHNGFGGQVEQPA